MAAILVITGGSYQLVIGVRPTGAVVRRRTGDAADIIGGHYAPEVALIWAAVLAAGVNLLVRRLVTCACVLGGVAHMLWNKMMLPSLLRS